MSTKKMISTGAAATIPAGNAIPTMDKNGAVTMVTQAAIQTAVLGGVTVEMAMDGVFIVYHQNSTGYARMVKVHAWPALQTAGEVADGVAIVEGGRILVVAPTEGSVVWSSAAITTGLETDVRKTVLQDWEGEAHTATIIGKSTENTVTDTATYAPGFCNLYSRSNANGKGLGAGKWWLPSIGELFMIYANMLRINYALSLIDGATQLKAAEYWSSSKYNVVQAWYIDLSNGALGYGNTTAVARRTRPVSTYIV